MLIKNQQRPHAIRQHRLPRLILAGDSQERGKPSLHSRLQLALQQNAELESRLETERSTRYQEGYAAGQKAGYAEGVQEVKAQVQALADIIDAFTEQHATFIQNEKTFVVVLALKTVEKILGSEAVRRLHLSEERLLSLMNDAVSAFPEAPEFLLHVHTDILQNVEKMREQIDEILPDKCSFRLVEDPSLQPGECIIECDYGALNARHEAQFEQIADIFLQLPGER